MSWWWADYATRALQQPYTPPKETQMNEKIISTLKRLATTLDKSFNDNSYACFDLRLAQVCEGDVQLVDSIKRLVAPHICGGVGPRAWVQDTIDFLDPCKPPDEVAFADADDIGLPPTETEIE